jgi:hypothetical protein
MKTQFCLTSGCMAKGQLFALLVILGADWGNAWAQITNNVTSGDTVNYTINSLPDPPFTFQRGVTYVFQLSSLPLHPFWIKTNLTGNLSGGAARYTNGVVNNGATSGSVIFSVPANAPDTLFYECGNHSAMNGTLTIVTPQSPPSVRIVFINVADFITLKSTGTNGWNAVPEYLCGLSDTSWTAVPAFTNSIVGGTNTITFQRLDALCGSSNVLLRVRNELIP